GLGGEQHDVVYRLHGIRDNAGRRKRKVAARLARNAQARSGEQRGALRPHEERDVCARLREPPAEIAAHRAGPQHQDLHVFLSPRRGSLPLASRRIFSRWRQISNSAIAPTAGVTGTRPNSDHAQNTAKTAAMIDASEIMRKKNTMMPNVASVPSPRYKFRESNTPAAVATPLPPLNPWNTGYRWPRNAIAPASGASNPVAGPCPV